MVVYINGQYVEEEEAMISIFDHGFLYGLGFFETFRTYAGKPFLLDEHLNRLHHSLQTLKISWEMDKLSVLQTISELLKRNQVEDAYFRLNVTAGIDVLGLPSGDYGKPTTIVYCKPIPEFPTEKSAIILKTVRNTPEGSFRTKSHHYMNNIIAKREMGSRLNTEGIFLTKEGFVAEGIVSNLFFRKDDCFYTPSVETGILEGITRNFIIKLIKKNGWRFEEGCYTVDELKQSDEMFVTNSIQEITRITDIDGTHIFPEMSEYMVKLLEDYREYTK